MDRRRLTDDDCLHYTTVLVLNAGRLTRSPWGMATLIGLLVMTVAVHLARPTSRAVFWAFAGLALLAFLWTAMCIPALFLPLIGTPMIRP